MWKNSMLSGSPPCSPQIPSSRCGFASRPFSTAICTSWPTPSRSSVWKGLTGRIFTFPLDAWLAQAIDVPEQEFALGIVAAEAKGCLCQVIGAKAEEIGDFCDLICCQCSPWQLDHCTKFVLDRGANLGSDLFSHRFKLAAHFLQFIDMSHQRDHDLGVNILTLFSQLKGCFENGTCLHDIDLGEEQSQAAAAQAKHGVHFAHGP